MSNGHRESIIEVREVRADELLRELSPHVGRLWALGRDVKHRDTAAAWVFRGQANGEDGKMWRLTPSAFRPPERTWRPFAPSANVEAVIGDDDDLRVTWELGIVRDFVAMADRYGFAIPDEAPEIRDHRLRGTPLAIDINAGTFDSFPPPALTATFALAQHYGIPTRLLDWCHRPLVAAYFACEGVARRREAGKNRPANEAPFSVFALRLRTPVLLETLDFDPQLHVITAATASNPHLRAQGGLFTLVQPRKRNVRPPDLDALLESVESNAPDDWRRVFPLLVEFRVPAKDSNWLLWQLSLLGITGALVYPGLKGVVNAILERRFHHFELLDRS